MCLDRYVANLSCKVKVKEDKILGLKSHDCHVLTQRLIPASVRGILDEDVCFPLVELGNFFQFSCSKTV